jgi:hypothetical protein
MFNNVYFSLYVTTLFGTGFTPQNKNLSLTSQRSWTIGFRDEMRS